MQGLQVLGVDLLDHHLTAVRDPAVTQRLDNADVRVLHAHVLTDQRDADPSGGTGDAFDHFLPLAQVRGPALQPQALHGNLPQPLPFQDQRHLIDGGHIQGLDHGLRVHVAKQRDLLLHPPGQRPLGAAHDHVGLNPNAAEFLHAVLRGFRLQLPRRRQVGHQRDVHVHHMLRADGPPELPDGLQERQPFDVADRAADFDDDHIGRRGCTNLPDLIFDLVGDVGNDLHRPAQVLPAALPGDHRAVDLPGGRVVVAAEVGVNEPLVVTQVHVGLGAVIGHEHLAVLVRIHGPGVDIDVRVELQHRHPQPARHEQPA